MYIIYFGSSIFSATYAWWLLSLVYIYTYRKTRNALRNLGNFSAMYAWWLLSLVYIYTYRKTRNALRNLGNVVPC